MIAGMNARILWIACLVTLAAVGCTADPKPNTSTVPPTPAASSSPRSSTPSVAPRPTVPADVPTTGTNLLARGEKPPVMPASALQHTDAGAVAFAKFYLQTVDWGFATTNAAYMRHYYERECVRCEAIDAAITSTATNHWHYIGARAVITSIGAFANNSHGSDRVYQARMNVNSYTAIDAKGAIHSADVAHSDFPEKVGVWWNGSAWRVVYAFGGTG
jgi:hypothetical protein